MSKTDVDPEYNEQTTRFFNVMLLINQV